MEKLDYHAFISQWFDNYLYNFETEMETNKDTVKKKKKTLLDTENASELHEYLGFKEMKIEGFKVVWLRLILNHGI